MITCIRLMNFHPSRMPQLSESGDWPGRPPVRTHRAQDSESDWPRRGPAGAPDTDNRCRDTGSLRPAAHRLGEPPSYSGPATVTVTVTVTDCAASQGTVRLSHGSDSDMYGDSRWTSESRSTLKLESKGRLAVLRLARTDSDDSLSDCHY
jgi:hypothetical protein